MKAERLPVWQCPVPLYCPQAASMTLLHPTRNGSCQAQLLRSDRFPWPGSNRVRRAAPLRHRRFIPSLDTKGGHCETRNQSCPAFSRLARLSGTHGSNHHLVCRACAGNGCPEPWVESSLAHHQPDRLLKLGAPAHRARPSEPVVFEDALTACGNRRDGSD